MARGLIAAQTLKLSSGKTYFPTLPLSAGTAALTMTDGDDMNGHFAPIVSGRTWLLAHNTDDSAQTVTILSAADAQNRKGDITAYSLAAGDICTFGPFTTAGWELTSPTGLQIDVSDATVKLAVITNPA